MFKKLLIIIVSFLFLESQLHLDHANHIESVGYSFCSEGCINDNHLSKTHHCEKCLNKDNRLFFANSFKLIKNENSSSIYPVQNIFSRSELLTVFSSRPPPEVL